MIYLNENLQQIVQAIRNLKENNSLENNDNKNKYLFDDLKDIADAIRSLSPEETEVLLKETNKTPKTLNEALNEIIDAIENIEIEHPEGKITITENGEDIDVAQYATADVEVQTGGDLESFIAGTSTSVTYEGEIVRDCAFAGMSDLEEVNLPNATYIGRGAFYNSYKDNTLSDTSEGDLSFNNDKLTTVNMPKVTNILGYAFYRCTGLTSINLPNTLIRIGCTAFSDSGLTSITIPESVLYINSGAFATCSSLTTVNFSNSLTPLEIGIGAFNDCSSLVEVNFPNSLFSIGSNGFGNCTSLTNIILPNSLTSIQDYAFYSCTNLSTIDLTSFSSTDSVPTLGYDVFANISPNAKLYFSDQTTLDAFAVAPYWSDLASTYTFTTDPVPSD